MATTCLMPLHAGKDRTVGNAISAIIDYVENPQKTDEGRLITSWACNSKIADAEFLYTKQEYIRKTGRVRGADDVIAYHLRQSFPPGEITAVEANRLGRELASRFTKGNHAFIVCTHIDKQHIHNHVIWNSTDLDATRKFRNFIGSSRAVRRLSDTICIENGYSIVVNPKRHGESYNKWLGDRKKASRREIFCEDIDAALQQKPTDFQALLKILEQSGYEIKRGKTPSACKQGWGKFLRFRSLGEGYSVEELKLVIAGQQAHRPRKKRVYESYPQKPASLLVDIQAKLQEGKGAGYVHWAKKFNLKQAAQTLIYLQENNLLNYPDLEARAELVSSQYRTVSKEIKSIDLRMSQIKTLQQNIINYSKTRSAYVAYREAGYSKKFKQEHEMDILLHQSAKKYFDELGIDKLPTIKSLQGEYSELLARKKEAYPKYRKLSSEMKEIATVKANVDRLLSMDVVPAREEQRSDSR